MLNENDLHALSHEHIRQVYADYKAAQPFDPGQLVSAESKDGLLSYGVCQVMRLWWSDDKWCWMVELLGRFGTKTETFTVQDDQCTRHIGWEGREVR